MLNYYDVLTIDLTGNSLATFEQQTIIIITIMHFL